MSLQIFLDVQNYFLHMSELFLEWEIVLHMTKRLPRRRGNIMLRDVKILEINNKNLKAKEIKTLVRYNYKVW